jgi:hypothetical protein
MIEAQVKKFAKEASASQETCQKTLPQSLNRKRRYSPKTKKQRKYIVEHLDDNLEAAMNRIEETPGAKRTAAADGWSVARDLVMEIIRKIWEGLDRAFEAIEQLISDALGVVTTIMVARDVIREPLKVAGGRGVFPWSFFERGRVFRVGLFCPMC